MNWRIRRVRLEAAGPPDARYDDVVLDFTDGERAAANAVVLLRNGGGKSLLLFLLFKALLPGSNDGTKTAAEQRGARPVVGAGECATVAIEWEHLDDGRRLITGHSFERGQDPDSRWLLEPVAGVLELDSLPLREGRHRRTRAGLLTALANRNQEEPRLRFRQVPGVRAWEQELEAVGIDVAQLKYQARLNRSEGGDDKALRFAQPEDFVRFVLAMVLEDDALETLQEQVEVHAEQLAGQEAKAADAAFSRQAAAVLAVLAEAHAAQGAAEKEHDRRRREAGRLAGVLERALADAELRQQQAEVLLEGLGAEESRLSTARRDETRERRVVTHRTADLAARDGERLLAELNEALALAAVERDARVLVDTLVELRGLQAKQEAVSRSLRAAAEGERAAHDGRARAAEVLSGALHAAAEERERAAEELEVALEAARRRRWQLDGHIDDGERDARRAAGGAAGLQATLDAHLVAVQRLRDQGVIDAGEAPADAAARLELERQELERSHGELADRVVQLEGRASTLDAQARERQAAAERADGQAERLRSAVGAAGGRLARRTSERVADALELSRAEVLLEDPARWRATLAERGDAASERRARADARAEGLRGDLTSLEADRLLAVDPDVRAACDHLEDRGVQAFPAMRHLAATLPAHRVAELLEQHPAIASGVVLQSSSPVEALGLLGASGMVPRRPIVLSALGDVNEAPAQAAVVLPPDPAAYDETHSPAALQRLQHAFEALQGESREHRELGGELTALLAELERGEEELRDFLPAALRDDRRLAAALHEHGTALAALQAELTARTEGLRGELAAAQEQLKGVREQLGAAEANMSRVTRQLDRLGDLDDLDADAIREEVNDLQQQARTALEAVAALREEREAGVVSATRLRVDQDAHLDAAGRHRRRAGGLPVQGTPVAAPGDLVALEAEWERADLALVQAATDPELLAERTAVEARVAPHREALAATSAEVRAQAEYYAASPAGVEPVARDRARRDAEEAHQYAVETRAVALHEQRALSTAADSARREVTQEDLGRAPKLLGSLTPASVAEGEEMLVELGGRRAEQDRWSADLQERRGRLETRVQEDELLAGELQAGRERLPVAAQVPDGPLDAWTRERPRVAREVHAAQQAIDHAAGELRAAQERVTSAHGDVISHASGASEQVPRGIVESVQVADLPVHAARLEPEMRNRATELDRQLAELEVHRRAIIASLHSTASDALRRLERVASATRLPDEAGLGEWAGRQFARLGLQRIEDESAQRAALGARLDDMITSGRRRGIDLAFGAALALLHARPAVHVLKPHPQPDGQYHPIEAVGPEFSGGEELTIKLVLFCAVAAVRTAERSGRARAGRRAGPLLIDNPIGTASRESLVDLQLRLAHHLHAQFIPFTGLEGELNVTGRFSCVVALTNDKDLLSGRRFVHAVADALGDWPVRPADARSGDAHVTALAYRPVTDVDALAAQARGR